MTQQEIHKLFDYKDGNLIWKIARNSRAKVGGVAGKTPHHSGYKVVTVDNHQYSQHRLVWIYHNGKIENNIEIDHINGIKNDNRIENLRIATRNQNIQNQSKRKHNTSGFKGINFHKASNKWAASIGYNKKRIHLGLRDTAEEASLLYQHAANKLHKQFAKY